MCLRCTLRNQSSKKCLPGKLPSAQLSPAALAGRAGMPLGPAAAPALPAVILPLLLGRTKVGPLLLLLLLVTGVAAASLLLPAALGADAAVPLPAVRAFLGGSVGVAFALEAADC